MSPKLFFTISTSVLLFCLVLLSFCHYHLDKKRYGPREPSIKVLLSHATGKSFRISTSHPSEIVDAGGKIWLKNKRIDSATISLRNGQICVNETPCHPISICINPGIGGVFAVNGKRYHGNATCLIYKGSLALINEVPLESYLLGVVGAEMPLSWPDASLRAQSIVARTYALYEKLNALQNEFDVYDTTSSQVYKGMEEENERVRQIVGETRGMVMFYQNEIFKAFFHSTCGGGTANASKVFGYQDIAPLSGRACHYCQDSPHAQWEAQASLSDFQELTRGLKLPGPFIGFSPQEKDPHGRVISLQIYFGKGQKSVVAASILRKQLGYGKLKSTLFEMTPINNGILFKGKGWGHGVGMCQTGAGAMGKMGLSTHDILDFYYPGVTLCRLWN